MFKGLPIYSADIDNTVEGIDIMSLVDRPTVEACFIKFAEGILVRLSTWLISIKVNYPALWADIKAGKYNGFSVEGIVNLSETTIAAEPSFKELKAAVMEDLANHLNNK